VYIEDLLPKPLKFEFKQVGLKWGVFEQVKKEDVTIEVGCVFVGTAAECRRYVEERKSKDALRVAERGLNPQVDRFGAINVICERNPRF